MTDTRTDEEVLCEHMEARPTVPLDNALELGLSGGNIASPGGWWICVCDYKEGDIPRWIHRPLDLDALREIEERLTEEQRLSYMLELSKGGPPDQGYWRLIHASAAQKIKALVTVVRGL